MKEESNSGKLNKVKLICAIIFIITTVFFVIKCIEFVSKPVNEFIVEQDSVSFEETVEGVLIRKETLVKGNNYKNGMVQIVSDGKKTAKGEKIFFTPDLRSYSDYKNFLHQYPTMDTRFDLFWQHIKQFDFGRFDHLELISSLIAPNWLLSTIIYLSLACYTFFIMFLDFKTILTQCAILIIAMFAGTISAKIRNDEIGYFLAYPLYSVGRLIYNFPFFIWARKLIKKATTPSTVEKMLVDVWVSDGKKNFPCKLELISNNGLSSVTFINMKNKKFRTKNNHLRMTDAIQELSTKLEEHGLSLKVCQCCKYFQPNVDGTTNMIKGFCKYNFAERVPGDILPTLIWNTCEQYEPLNVVSLFESFNNK